MKPKSLLFYFAFALGTNVYTTNGQVNEQDSLAVVNLYNSTKGPNWNNHTNWLTHSPVSTWYGITVTNKRVTEIALQFNGLNGSIPVSIGDLTKLTFLSLVGSRLTNIPSSLGNLTNLIELDLSVTGLSGSIPSSFGKLVNLFSFAGVSSITLCVSYGTRRIANL